jgi:signal transduction histidine kinase
MEPPVLHDEAERIAALYELELLDTPREERFDRITRTVQRILGVPIALITLVDVERQWFKSCQGLAETETPRSASFCAHALHSDEIMVVPDSHADPRFVDNPLVTGSPYIRFYAGKPLRSPSGYRLGTLCAIDIEPRGFTHADAVALTDLAHWAELEFTVVTVSRAVAERDRMRRRLQTIADSMGEGLCVLDADRRIERANRALAELTGRSPSELVGTPLDTFLDGDVLRRVDGTTIDVRVTRAAMRDEEGSTVVVLADASEERAVERLKDEIISVTGHELRTPLTAIRGSLGLLQAGVAGELGDQGRLLVDNALRNSDRLIRLVNDMLDVERLAAGRMPMAQLPVDLREAARAAADGLIAVSDAAQVTVHVETGNQPAVVTGDRDRLVQVLSNLIDNAVKFSPAGSTVRVAVMVDGREALAAISDTGPGMSAAEIATIFDRFNQLDNGPARAAAGSGLGLAIVQGIVGAHGGRVDVEAETGVGSTFTVRLPKADG